MNNKLFAPLMAGAILALPIGAMADTYTVNFTATPPTIDGVVSEGEWDAAGDWITGFTEHSSPTAEDSTEPTRVKALYSVDGIYFLFDCTDTDVVSVTVDSEYLGAPQTEGMPGRVPPSDAGWTFAGTDYCAIYIDPANVSDVEGEDVDNPNFYSYSLQFEPSITANDERDARGNSHNYTEFGQFGGAWIKLDEPHTAPNGTEYFWTGGLSWELFDGKIVDGTKADGYIVEVFIPWSDLNHNYFLRGAEFVGADDVWTSDFASNEFATQGMIEVEGGAVSGMPMPGTEWKVQLCRHSASASPDYVNWVGDTGGFVSRPFGTFVFGDAPPTAVRDALQHRN